MQAQLSCQEIKVLLVEDPPSDSSTIESALSEARGAMAVRTGLFLVRRAARLACALKVLAGEPFDVVLLDLGLPDSEGLEALNRLRATAPDVPVVVLTTSDDDGLALQAVRQGAQDCVAKDRLEGRLLRRIILHAIQRQRSERELLGHTRRLEQAGARIEQQAAELKVRAEQLDRINRELDDFAWIASHDLKEPLRGISDYCQILLEDYADKVDAEGKRRLESLVTMCCRLGVSIDDLLTYCRVGRVRCCESPIDLNACVEEVVQAFAPTIGRPPASVHVVSQLPRVKGDATLIGKVLANLISNGMKFNESGRPRVEIGCLPGDPPAIYVRDNGIGIARRHQEAIFTIFRRLHSRRKYEGSGAGLTIVRKIVEAHGGRVWLESEPGRGSTFFFTLGGVRDPKPAKPPTKPPHWGQPRRDRCVAADAPAR